MNKPAAIYARVSSDRQKENHTIDSQTEALIDYAQAHGYAVPAERVFHDEGYSGAILVRPGFSFDVLLYDLTSTYVEGEAELNPKAKRGYSRDGRPDCKQVVVALVITPEGFPLAYEVINGNTSDKTTLRDFLEKIESLYGKARPVWLMYRGIPTEAILQEMRDPAREMFYLAGTPKSLREASAPFLGYTASSMSMKYFAPLFWAAVVAAQQPSKPATVVGTVVNSVTGAPLAKTSVTIANGELSEQIAAVMRLAGNTAGLSGVADKSYSATTDATGRFRFDNVTPGNYWVVAKKTGFGDEHYRHKGPTAGERGSIRVSAGKEIEPINLKITPLGTVSGRVLDEDGEPFPSATVTALAETFGTGHRRFTASDVSQSNGRGEFTLTKLLPGRYIICAAMQHFALPGMSSSPPPDGSPETAYVSTCMPDVAEVSQAEKVAVAAGEEANGLTIRMKKRPVVRVRGKLVDEAGQPIKSAQIMVMAGVGAPGTMALTMVSDPEGKFELTDIQPGVHTIMISQIQGSSSGMKMSIETLSVPTKGADNIKLGAHPETSVKGKVVVEGGKIPVKDFSVMLTPADGLAVMPVTTTADETGAFTLAHITPASYDPWFPVIPEGSYLKGIDFNGRDVLGKSLDLATISNGILHILLGTDGCTVQVKVSADNKPAVGATVVLLPVDPGRRFQDAVRKGSSDESGHVSLSDVPPGDYLAFAWEDVREGSWYDPDFIRGQPGAARVSIRPKSTEQLDLALIAAGK